MDALATHIQIEIHEGIMTQMEKAKDKYKRKIVIPLTGKTDDALCLRESRYRISRAQWFVGRFSRNPHSTHAYELKLKNESSTHGLGATQPPVGSHVTYLDQISNYYEKATSWRGA